MPATIESLPKDCLILILKNIPSDYKNTALTSNLWYHASLEAKLALQEEKLTKASIPSKCFLVFDITRLHFKIFKISLKEQTVDSYFSLTAKCNALFHLHSDVLEQLESSNKALQRALSIIV